MQRRPVRATDTATYRCGAASVARPVHLRRGFYSLIEGSYLFFLRWSLRLRWLVVAVSLVVILVMAVVSGGDAIFGELPFTILGFLIFFVIFWLMIAWIF